MFNSPEEEADAASEYFFAKLAELIIARGGKAHNCIAKMELPTELADLVLKNVIEKAKEMNLDGFVAVLDTVPGNPDSRTITGGHKEAIERGADKAKLIGPEEVQKMAEQRLDEMIKEELGKGPKTERSSSRWPYL